MRNFTDNLANLNGQFKFLVWGVFQHINPPTSAMFRENAEVIIFEDSRRAPEAAPMGSVRTSEEPKRPINLPDGFSLNAANRVIDENGQFVSAERMAEIAGDLKADEDVHKLEGQ